MSGSPSTAGDGPSPAKRLRKGTRSCLACRRRKAKCIFPSDQHHLCTQCEQHKLQCIPQGAVNETETSHSRRAKLKERVDQLQSLVNQLVPDNREYAGPAGDENDPIVKALDDLLPGIRDAATPTQVPTLTQVPQAAVQEKPFDGVRQPHDDEAEEPMESHAAPLMSLLSGPARSTQSDSPTAGPRANLELRGPNFAQAVKDLSIAMPSQADMDEVFATRSSWWPLWRTSLGLVWGNAESNTLKAFATQAFAEADPCLLAILLVAFAIATGDRKRFLPSVELHVVNNDVLAGTEHGLSCLMILGLCHLNALQPRRAWSVYRRANSLLQLNGIHLRHKGSPKRESIFWQLFHADRWVSLMIGMPYMVPDHLADVSISPVGELSAETFLYRHLAVMTGRVVDCLNGADGPSLLAALQVEERMQDVTIQLPPGFLEIKQIRECHNRDEKMIRLYRSVHFHQLRAYLHIPFFLRTSSSERYEYSRKNCVSDSRRLIEAFVEIFATDPSAASDGSVLNCTAFTATVVVLLGVLGYDRQDHQHINAQPCDEDDWRLIYRALDAIKYGILGIAGALCRQCYDALDTLIRYAHSTERQQDASVVLPYFGTVTFRRKIAAAPPQPKVGQLDHRGTFGQTYDTNSNGQSAAMPTMVGSGTGISSAAYSGGVLENPQLDGLQLDYYSPFAQGGPLASWLPPEWSGLQAPPGGEQPWDSGFDPGTGWDWLNADLPPNLTF